VWRRFLPIEVTVAAKKKARRRENKNFLATKLAAMYGAKDVPPIARKKKKGAKRAPIELEIQMLSPRKILLKITDKRLIVAHVETKEVEFEKPGSHLLDFTCCEHDGLPAVRIRQPVTVEPWDEGKKEA
jgi:hypothetical protein